MSMPIAAFRPSRVRSLSVCCLVAATLVSPASLGAQQLDSLPVDSLPHETSIQWWQGAAALGGVSALMLLDGSIRNAVQTHRSAGADRVAKTVRHFGQPEVYATVPVALLLAGAIGHDARLTHIGGRVLASLAVAGAAGTGMKFVTGRARPDGPGIDADADDFGLFSGRDAWPSGHTSMAFAFATSLGDELHNPWARWGLYGAATAVAWSRVNDNRHWTSDVAMGALVGIASAKFASGRWRIFGLRAPSFIAGPRGMGLGWQAKF
jgi:membrane-associated phospholipid phosphatase